MEEEAAAKAANEAAAVTAAEKAAAARVAEEAAAAATAAEEAAVVEAGREAAAAARVWHATSWFERRGNRHFMPLANMQSCCGVTSNPARLEVC